MTTDLDGGAARPSFAAVSSSPTAPRTATWAVVAALLVLVVSLAIRVPWLTRIEATNDEILHLESYRNRYSENLSHPVFLRRLETHPRIPESVRQYLLSWYDSSKAFRFGLFLLGDPPSQVYGLLMESIRGVFGSNVVALRVPSLLFAGVALWTLFLIGRTLTGDATVGLLMLVLGAVSPLAEIYSAIARGHMFGQMGILLLILAFVRARTGRGSSNWVFIAALLTQVTHWGTWLIVFPFVAAEAILIYRRAGSFKRLLRATWWYVLVSLLLVASFVPVSLFTSAQGNLGYKGASLLATWYGVASPLGVVDGLRASLTIPAALLWLGTAGLGAWLLAKSSLPAPIRLVLPLSLPFVIVSSLIMCQGIRHMVIYMPVILVLSGLGLAWVLRPARLRLAAALLMFVGLQGASLYAQDDPYRRILDIDTRYSPMAALLRQEVGAEDRWLAWPSFWADCLYAHQPPGPPLPSFDMAVFKESLRQPGVRYLFLVTRDRQGVDAVPELAIPPLQEWRFGDHYSIFKFDVEQIRDAAATTRAATRPPD